MSFDAVFSAMTKNAYAKNSAESDYINQADGLLYCGKCHTPKEKYYPEDITRLIGIDRHPGECKCACEERERQEKKERDAARRERIHELRSEAFKGIPAATAWRFDNATVKSPQLEKAKTYADQWNEICNEGIGLLLFGNVGTGKSFAAGCIANALLDRMIPVLYVRTPDVISRMQSNFGADREEYLNKIMSVPLLILDDLGAERNTSYGKECVFDVVDRRMMSKKPMIVTTNIPLSAMKEATDIDERRIYDRILEKCVPLVFNGENLRNKKAVENTNNAKRLMHLQ